MQAFLHHNHLLSSQPQLAQVLLQKWVDVGLCCNLAHAHQQVAVASKQAAAARIQPVAATAAAVTAAHAGKMVFT